MRCTRCDGLIVPQAVGIDRQGRVVFGWCRRCLEDQHCKLVETSPLRFSGARRPLLSAARSDRRPRTALTMFLVESGRFPGTGVLIAISMAVWGIVLLSAGLWVALHPTPDRSPFGNGTPAFFLSGGLVTILVSLALFQVNSRTRR